MKHEVWASDDLLTRVATAQRRMEEIDAELREGEAHRVCVVSRDAWIAVQHGRGKLRSTMRMMLHRETFRAAMSAIKWQIAGDKEGSKEIVAQACPEYRAFLSAYAGRARARMRDARFSEAAQAQQSALLELIARHRAAGKPAALFMAPYFSKERLSDGYFQRVQAVDGLLGENLLGVYCSWLDADEVGGLWRCRVWDERHIEIAFPRWDEAAWARVREIAHAAKVVYHHSVTFADERITRDDALVKIVDLHGAYPEELRMYGRRWRAETDERQEEIALRHAQQVICVSRAMEAHIREKYPGGVAGACIIMPIMKPELLTQAREAHKPLEGMYEVIYAGGLQRWQCVDEMRGAMRRTKAVCRYHICTGEPQRFLEGFEPGRAPERMVVESVPPQRMAQAYRTAHFGFVLRKNSAVNRVSCPTKLMEYIATDVVPILDCALLGDFVADGMRYVTLDDFLAGKLPSPSEREKMARANRAVLAGMAQAYRQGAQGLRALVQGYASADPNSNAKGEETR